MAGNGVRLATGYIEISAETSKVPQQIQDALNKAAQGAKPAGEKIGTEVSKGINDGLNSGSGGSKPLPQVIHEQAKPRETGRKIGKDVKDGIDEGMRGAGEGPLSIIKGATRDFGRELASSIQSGQYEHALNRVGDVVANTTRAVNGLGRTVGVNLDSVEKFGSKTADVIDDVGKKIQGVAGDLNDAATGIRKIHEGDTAGKLQGVAQSTGAIADAAKLLGVNLGDTPDKIISIAGAAAGVAQTAIAAKELTAAFLVPPNAAWLKLLGSLALLGVGAVPDVRTVPDQDMIDQTNKMRAKAGKPPLQPGDEIPGTGGHRVPGGAGTPPPSRNVPGSGNPSTQRNQDNLLPVTQDVKDSLNYWFPGHTIGGYRQDQPQYANEHPAGKALDYMINSKDEGYKALPFALSQPGVDYVIFDGKMWYPDGRSEAYYGDNPHNDHLHIHTEPGGQPGSGQTYDEGGILQPGVTIAINSSGKPEVILDPEKSQQHLGTGAPPGPKPGERPSAADQPDAAKPALEAIDAMRSMGLIPQGAGSKAVAGTSMIAGFLNLGNEAIGGLIDAGASAAVQAIGIAAAAGAGAGSFGGGAAAGPLASGAASIPIGIAANEGKRAVSYGFQLASIAADSVIDQIFGPFGGPPRWIGFDYSQFMPQIDVGGIATTTVEKAFAAAQAGGNVPASQQPGGPVVPQMQTGGQPVGQTLPRFGTMAAPLEQTAIPHLGSGQPPGPPPGAGPPQGPTSRPGQTGDKVATLNPPPPPPPTSTAPGPQPPQNQPSPFGLFSPTEWLGFDEGGVWPPGRPGMNATGRPELVLSPAQLDMIASAPELNGGWGAGDTYHITAMDAADVARQIDARKQLAMMRYAGRP